MPLFSLQSNKTLQNISWEEDMQRRKFLVHGAALALLIWGAIAVSAQDENYVVQPGDTLTSIAQQYNISTDAILVRNGMTNGSLIRRGQTLIIPVGGVAMPFTHTVQPGESLTAIANLYSTTVQALADANNMTAATRIVPGQVLNLPATGGPNVGQGGGVVLGPANYERLHTVDIGEDLRSIAAVYGTTWDVLARANGITTPNYIQAGTVLRIPAAGATGGPIVTPTPTTPAPLPLPVPMTPRLTYNGYYWVQPGDTMFAISSEFNVDIYNIARANGLLNLNSIYAGQALFIPGR
jgi:lysozyme